MPKNSVKITSEVCRQYIEYTNTDTLSVIQLKLTAIRDNQSVMNSDAKNSIQFLLDLLAAYDQEVARLNNLINKKKIEDISNRAVSSADI